MFLGFFSQLFSIGLCKVSIFDFIVSLYVKLVYISPKWYFFLFLIFDFWFLVFWFFSFERVSGYPKCDIYRWKVN